VRVPRPTRSENHNTFDTAFKEDDRPWIEADANGMLVVLLVRRIAYTFALFRSVTLGSERNQAMRWKDLLAGSAIPLLEPWPVRSLAYALARLSPPHSEDVPGSDRRRYIEGA